MTQRSERDLHKSQWEALKAYSWELQAAIDLVTDLRAVAIAKKRLSNVISDLNEQAS